LEGVAAEHFMSLARQLMMAQKHRNAYEFDLLCNQEVEWARTNPHLNGQREVYEASVRVLVDLVRLNWEIKEMGWGLELHNSSPEKRKGLTNSQVQESKNSIRNQLKPLVNFQFDKKPVRDFIDKMEQLNPNSERKSILNLIADGSELYSRLQPAIRLKGKERLESLSTIIKPYLQLVNPGQKDQYTNILLGDIWRYFRYTWSIPQTPIPGRQILYLVRDAAHPYHAIMGLASLNNCALNMGAKREDYLEWSIDSINRQITDAINSDNASNNLKLFYEYLNNLITDGLKEINYTHLCEKKDIENPIEELIISLRKRGEMLAGKRGEMLSKTTGLNDKSLVPIIDDEYLNAIVSDEVLALDKTNMPKRMQKARRYLVLKKRAMLLARLLNARIIMKKYMNEFINPESVLSLFKRDDFNVALRSILDILKGKYAGTNMLEITTCGGIPPYNGLLSGKLTALMLLSPQVSCDYKQRYNGPSIISSQLKNELVIKDNSLVYLGTTSLYSIGSSQYERLRLPGGIISSEQPEIRYRLLGETSGYGTVQFSNETVKAVEKVTTIDKGYKNVNSVFGEGPSPRLRKLTVGLSLLGFNADSLMKHNQKRLVYGVLLCNEAKDFLSGRELELPKYLTLPEDYLDASERIADFWKERWLSSRIDYQPSIAKLAVTRSWKLSEMIPVKRMDQVEVENEASFAVDKLVRSDGGYEMDVKFWRSLAQAGPNVTSDELSEKELDRLHVIRPVEEFIIDKVKQGFSIVLTGNAGDGKTHLLKRLAPTLQKHNAVIEEDATASMMNGKIDSILNAWRQALLDGQPYCLAANEYPLFLLRSQGQKDLPILKEVDRQCRNRLSYGPETDFEDAMEKVLVIDLSLRNPLSTSFCKSMLDKILKDEALKNYAKQNIDPSFTSNFTRLCDERVQKRLLDLFNRIAQRGYRSTVRELWIILARLLFDANPNNSDYDQSINSWYSERLFTLDQRFRLSELLYEMGDPCQCSHPQWDRKLEQPSGTKESDWYFGLPKVTVETSLDIPQFNALKRAFYFEHKAGNQVFSLDEDHASNFCELISKANDDDPIYKIKVIRAINSCYCAVSFPGNEAALYLWVGHRFHEQPTRSYIASQKIISDDLRMYLPRVPRRLGDSIEYVPDHFDIQYQKENNKMVRLKVNYLLYRTLCKLLYGLPRNLMPDSDINRLDLFIEQLHTLNVEQSREFICFNVGTREAARVRLANSYKCFEEVESLGS